MRKLYFSLLAVLISLVSFTASAQKTVKIKAAANGIAYYIDPSSFTPVAITTEEQEVTLPASAGGIQVNANTDYKITKITLQWDGGSYVYSDSAVDGQWIQSSTMKTGDLIYIEGENAGASGGSVLTFSGPADAYYISYDYMDYEPDTDGIVKIENYSSTSYATVYAKNGNEFDKITDQYGTNYTHYNTYASIYLGSLPAEDCILTIEMADLSELCTMEVEVEGTGGYVRFNSSASYDDIYLYTGSQNITFRPGTTFTITNWYYAPSLYKVWLNGVEVARQGSQWTIAPADGDKLKIETDFPAEDAKLRVTFGEGCDAGIVSEFRFNNNLIDRSEWTAADFTVQTGKEISLRINTAAYENPVVKFNGIEQTLSYGYVNFTVEKTDNTLEFSGTKLADTKIYVATNTPGAFYITEGYTQTRIEFDNTKEYVQVAVPAGVTEIKFNANENFIIKAISKNDSEQNINYTVAISEGDLIEVDASELKRDKTAVVYCEPYPWAYISFWLSNDDYNRRVTYTPEAGYNFYNYAAEDVPFGLGAYPGGDAGSTFTVYLNEEELENNYGVYPGLNGFQDGDVIKFFTGTPEKLSLSYSIDEKAASLVSVTHDHVRPIDSPSTHDVLPGTQVHIAEMTSRAQSESGLVVKVNGVELSPEEDGRYAFTVDKETNVVVTATTTGVENIASNLNTNNSGVYNIHGIRVADDAASLPSGLYIVNGKKTLIRK